MTFGIHVASGQQRVHRESLGIAVLARSATANLPLIRQDEPTEDQSSVYMIFERLNTGGVNLQPQEIRVALYHGEFVRVLRKLNEHAAWRHLYGTRSRRLKDMEMILRFFAFLYHTSSYRSPMKEFLNRYMASNKDLGRQREDELEQIFNDTVIVLDKAVGVQAFRPARAVNAAVVDSVMTGLARRIKREPISDPSQVAQEYATLMDNESYRKAVETSAPSWCPNRTVHPIFRGECLR